MPRARYAIHRRSAAVISVGVLVAAGLAVHALALDGTTSDVAGDALYAAAAYAAVVVVAPRMRSAGAAALAAGWCIFIELFQLTGIPLEVGGAFPPARLVLGTAFDPRDLVVYLLAVGVAWAVDAGATTAAARRDSGNQISGDRTHGP